MKGSPTRKTDVNASQHGSLISFNAGNNLKHEIPDEIDTSIFAKIGMEIEQQFNKSISQVERSFRDNMVEIKQVFYDKLQEFKAYNDALQQNHNMIALQYEAT